MIAIITVHFGKDTTIMRLAQSLAPHLGSDIRWYIVDNNEYTDAEHARFAEQISHARHIHAPYNGGFGAGNNIGVTHARADGATWFVFLNSDTHVTPTFRDTLTKDLAGKTGLIALHVEEGGVQITSGRVSYAQGMPMGMRGTYDLGDARIYVHGAACAIDRESGDTIGWWDERFFLYWEDVALTWAARQQGIPIRVGDTSVMHEGSVATKTLANKSLATLHARNYLFVEWRLGSKARALCWATFALVRAALGMLFGRAYWRGVWRGIWMAARDMQGNPDAHRIHVGIEAESLEDPVGGVARMTRELVRELAEQPRLARRFVFHLYFKSTIVDGPWKHAPYMQCHVTKPPYTPASFNIHYHVWMPLLAYWHGVRVLYFPNYMLPFTWMRAALVMLTPDVGYEMFGTSLPLKYRLAYRLFAGWAYRRATSVMTLSHDSAHLLATAFRQPIRSVMVNHLAVRYSGDTDNTPREPLFAWVGQAFERRHVQELLEAFRDMQKTNPDIAGVFAGADKYTPPRLASMVDKLAQQGVRITYTPHISEPDLNALYAKTHAIVYVSDAESFGLPPLEGAARGAIPIVADTPLSHEIFGDTALYVPLPVTVAGIHKALEASLAYRADGAFRDRIRARAATYTWRAHAERWIEAIATISP